MECVDMLCQDSDKVQQSAKQTQALALGDVGHSKPSKPLGSEMDFKEIFSLSAHFACYH